MSSEIATPSFYADFQGLTALKKDVKGDDPQAIREAARQFESLFTDMMLKSMRAAKLGEGLGDSDETDFYQDMYDQQLSVEMSQGKGLGLADMLVQQLTRSGAIKGAAASVSSGAARSRATSGGAPTIGTVPGSTPTSGAAAGSTPSKGSTAVSHRQRIGFVQSVAPYAQRAAKALGVSSDALIAQAALETGWGQHQPAANGSSSHNLFGIKAGSGWGGAAVSAQTTEYSQGMPAQVTQAFRAYGSIQQGVGDYVNLLQRDSGYQAALGTGADVTAFATALQRGGYATDPDYVQKLLATVATVRQLRGAQAGPAAAGQAPPLVADASDAALKLRPGAPISRGEEPA